MRGSDAVGLLLRGAGTVVRLVCGREWLLPSVSTGRAALAGAGRWRGSCPGGAALNGASTGGCGWGGPRAA
ncbi:hypothetical protein GCM10027203_09440 [Nonomuraea fastidiosa]